MISLSRGSDGRGRRGGSAALSRSDPPPPPFAIGGGGSPREGSLGDNRAFGAVGLGQQVLGLVAVAAISGERRLSIAHDLRPPRPRRQPANENFPFLLLLLPSLPPPPAPFSSVSFFRQLPRRISRCGTFSSSSARPAPLVVVVVFFAGRSFLLGFCLFPYASCGPPGNRVSRKASLAKRAV